MLFSVVSNFAETLFWFCEKLRHSRHTAVETIIYYSTYYLEKKSGWGNHISFQATPICWFYDARCWKKKKRFLLCAPTLIACFKVLRHNTKTNKQTKTIMLRKRKQAVFKTATVIAVNKKLWKLEKLIGTFWQEKNENKKQNKNKKKQNKQPVFHHFFPLHQIWPWWWTQAKKLLSLLQI